MELDENQDATKHAYEAASVLLHETGCGNFALSATVETMVAFHGGASAAAPRNAGEGPAIIVSSAPDLPASLPSAVYWARQHSPPPPLSSSPASSSSLAGSPASQPTVNRVEARCLFCGRGGQRDDFFVFTVPRVTPVTVCAECIFTDMKEWHRNTSLARDIVRVYAPP